MKTYFVVLAGLVRARAISNVGFPERSLATLLLSWLPSPQSPTGRTGSQHASVSRREALTKVGGLAAFSFGNAHQQAAFADDEQPVTEQPVTEAPTPPPTTTPKPEFQEYTGVRELKKDYKAAAFLLIANMKAATELNRGDPGVENVKMFRTQMTDFFSQYRRFDKIKGTPSFTTLYDCINILAGHYASYGEKYPIPEKRRVRLRQLYKEAERALARGK